MRPCLFAATAAALVLTAAPALAGGGCGSAPAIIADRTLVPAEVEARTVRAGGVPVAPRAVGEVIVTPGVATVAGIRPAPVAPPALYIIENDRVTSRSGG